MPAVAELIANAWDADSASVDVRVPEDPKTEGAEIIVKDTGHGMTFDELNTFYHGWVRATAEGSKTGKGARCVSGTKGRIGKRCFRIAVTQDMLCGRKDKHAVEIVMNYAALRAKPPSVEFEFDPSYDGPTDEPNGVTCHFSPPEVEASNQHRCLPSQHGAAIRFAHRPDENRSEW